MLKIITTLSIFLSSLAFGQETVHSQIKSLANTIYVSVDSTELSLEELEKIKNSLVKINALLKEELPLPDEPIDPTDPSLDYDIERCKKMAKSAYLSSFSSGTAREKAIELCTTYKDLELLKFFYSTYSQSYSAAKAMDMAGARSGVQVAGKYQLAKSIYPVYAVSYGPVAASDKTGQALVKLQIDSLPCVKDAYVDYSQSFAPGIAMDKSIDECKVIED